MKDKYSFKKYNKNFPRLFQLEKTRLKKLVGIVKIEHVGSTAVPGLKGKGIIDIVVGVNKNEFNKVKNKLIKGGYTFRPVAGEKSRLFFEKDYKHRGKTRRVHVHLTYHKGKDWSRMVAVREYLKTDLAERAKYEKIKKEGVMVCKGVGKAYRKHKHKYLENLSKKALKNVN